MFANISYLPWDILILMAVLALAALAGLIAIPVILYRHIASQKGPKILKGISYVTTDKEILKRGSVESDIPVPKKKGK